MDPEPCDDCDTGISLFFCFDGVRRCKNCIWTIAVANGWDLPPDLPPSAPSPAPLPVAPAPLSPAERKALREEKKERAKAQGTIL